MEKTVEAKLKELFEVQVIDSKIDKIHSIRGELPMEVSDLEDELEGLKTRVEKLTKEIEQLNTNIDEQKQAIKDSEGLVKKYDEQLSDVKNNREYLALTKEIELQKLEKMASEKKIKTYGEEIENKKELIKESQELEKERKKDLEQKKKELKSIVSETEKEEKALNKKRDTILAGVEDRLEKAYNKIRTSYNNGLAVVSIERDSCGGCFSVIPPQRQLDIGTRKKIIACEHCGRVLVDSDLSEEIREKVNKEVSA